MNLRSVRVDSREIVSASDLIPLAAVLFFWIAGKVLLPVPTHLDAPFSAFQLLGAFSVFLFWLSCTVGWGLLLGKWLGTSWRAPSLCLAWGVLIQITFAALAGHLGWIGFGSSTFFTLFSFLGAFLGVFQLKKICSRMPSASWPLYAALALFTYLAAWLISEASIAHFLPDPFVYDLLGPRLWFKAGKIYADPKMPIAFQASYWDYLLIHGNALMAEPDGGGIMEVQLFGQWLHVFSCLGSAYYLVRVLRKFGASPVWAWLGAIVGILNALNCWTVFQAKNDWGTIFLFFAGALALISAGRRKQIQWASGILFGVAFGAKITIAITGGPIAIALLYMTQSEKSDRSKCGFADSEKIFGRLALGFILGALPLLLRNRSATGNPVFPIMPELFQNSFLAQTRIEASRFGYTAFQALPARILHLYRNEIWLLVFFAFTPIFLWMKSWRLRPLVWASIFSWVFFLFFVGDWLGLDDGTHVMRLLGPGIPLSLGLVTVGSAELLMRLLKPGKIRKIALCILAFFVLLPHVLMNRDLYHFPNPFSALENLVTATRKLPKGGWSMAWLRLNASPQDPVVTTGFNFLYYISDLNVTSLLDNAAIDHLYRQSPAEPMRLLRALDSAGVVYLLDVPHWEQRYWTRTASQLDQLVQSNPTTVAASDPNGGWIVNVHDLLEESTQSCVPPQPVPLDLLQLSFKA